MGSVTPSFSVRVVDLVGRQLSDDKTVFATDPNQDIGDIKVRRADKEGLLVTNGTGKAEFVSEGNAIKLLIDGHEAFGRVAEEMSRAKKSINLTQLFFALPKKFNKDNEAIDPDSKEPKEQPALIFKFNSETFDQIDPNKPGAPTAPAPRLGEVRPERVLLETATTNKAVVRILLNQPSLGAPEGFFLLGVFSSLAAGLGAGAIAAIAGFVGIGLAVFPLFIVLLFLELVKVARVLDSSSDVEEATAYFSSAVTAAAPDRPQINVRGFLQPLPDNGVMHCKMMIADEKRAVVIGSPFSQRYFDTFQHKVEDAMRGSTTSEMVHDLSIAVVGPAAPHLFETFRQYWNEDLPENEKLKPSTEPTPTAETSGEDDVARVQVVRTISGKRFKGLKGKSEKGILEGYLRAFAAAKHYIYIENQYFTDSGITDALVGALNANQNLEVILVVPIKPDVIFYPTRQAKRIEQIRKAGGNRVGVFTRWTYERAKTARPWVAPVYIHAKGAVVDDSWCTVGSANLDGLSLDYNLLLSPLVFGETTATELNINVIPPSPGQVTKFAALMRRRLWAEHLGLLKDGVPNPDDEKLKPGPENKWLGLWTACAKAALDHVKAGTQKELPGFVLEYPKEDGGCLDTPRKHLGALGIEVDIAKTVIRPITRTRSFHFPSGKWDHIPELEDFN